VHLDEPLRERQADSEAAARTPAGLRENRLEDAIEHVIRYPDAGILDDHHRIRFAPPDREPNAPALRL